MRWKEKGRGSLEKGDEIKGIICGGCARYSPSRRFDFSTRRTDPERGKGKKGKKEKAHNVGMTVVIGAGVGLSRDTLTAKAGEKEFGGKGKGGRKGLSNTRLSSRSTAR